MVDFSKLQDRTPNPPPLVPRLIVGITGHRPHKLHSPGQNDGYDRNNPLRCWIREEIKQITDSLIRKYANSRHIRCNSPEWIDSQLRHVRWQKMPEDFTQPIAVSGVALGTDQDACGVWLRMGIPFIAAIPFPGQELRWPKASQGVYQAVLRAAAGLMYVSENPPKDDQEACRFLLNRNDWMVFFVDEMLAVFDGTKGGTSHAVRAWRCSGAAAESRLHRIDPRDFPRGERSNA